VSDAARIIALTAEAEARARECDRLRAENAAMRSREATARHHLAMALRALDHDYHPTADMHTKAARDHG
jgi:hypothetical protein